MNQSEVSSFDREASFAEVFETEDSRVFMRWLCELSGQEFLLVGRKGESVSAPGESERLRQLPFPSGPLLPRQPTRYRAADGTSSLGLPVSHEGDTFALLVVEDQAVLDLGRQRRLRLIAEIVEWYIYVIHQRRMITELHDHAQSLSYQDLLREHQRVVESERKYRELAQNLEQRVEERKRELEMTQQKLLQNEKMASVGQLAAGVAHEINNPTGFILSNLQTLQKYHRSLDLMLKEARQIVAASNLPGARVFLERWKKEDLDFILNDLPTLATQSLNGAERITRIVRGLSRFSHSGQDELESVNVNEILESSVELLGNEIKYKARLEKRYGELPLIAGRPSQLSQVFVNLIVNALQSLDKKDGQIVLLTRPEREGVLVTVRDNGKGIARENLDHIFNPFFTTKPVGQGTGLGLSISYEIVKSHQGELLAESEPGQGSSFHVYLPREPDKEK